MLKLILAAALFAAVPAVAQTGDAAASIAAAMAPREQFKSFIRQTLEMSTTGQTVVAKLGRERADTIFAAETDKVVAKYGAEWEANLASSYRESLTPAELTTASTAVATRDANSAAVMRPLMEKVGAAMQAKSTPLLEKASVEAATAAFEQANK